MALGDFSEQSQPGLLVFPFLKINQSRVFRWQGNFNWIQILGVLPLGLDEVLILNESSNESVHEFMFLQVFLSVKVKLLPVDFQSKRSKLI